MPTDSRAGPRVAAGPRGQSGARARALPARQAAKGTPTPPERPPLGRPPAAQPPKPLAAPRTRGSAGRPRHGAARGAASPAVARGQLRGRELLHYLGVALEVLSNLKARRRAGRAGWRGTFPWHQKAAQRGRGGGGGPPVWHQAGTVHSWRAEGRGAARAAAPAVGGASGQTAGRWGRLPPPSRGPAAAANGAGKAGKWLRSEVGPPPGHTVVVRSER
jgi:hypothetical protein